MIRQGKVIIQNWYDFYTFAREYFLYNLRMKVVPMNLPEIGHIIPNEPDKIFLPLLNEDWKYY